MGWITYRGRRAYEIENDSLRVVVTAEGGHVAQILHKASGISPLWTPPWPSLEPSLYSHDSAPEYGRSQESIILASIMGHSLCLDTYGAPSSEEAAAGMPIHGEAPVVGYTIDSTGPHSVRMSATLPLAQIEFERELALDGESVLFQERIRNQAAFDRPIAWTQHVTLGPPFLSHGETEFCLPATRSTVIDQDFGGAQKRGAEFDWPMCPRTEGGSDNLERFTKERGSAGFTTHLMDPARDNSFFIAWSPESKLLFGYVWRRADFPWVCRWEENHTRQDPPWNGRTVACAFEFGVSPTIESRRAMVERGRLFGEPAYRWLAARGTLEASYRAFARRADRLDKMEALTFRV